MTGARWAVLVAACVVVAAAGFGLGLGTVALFGDSETISGSFTVADEPRWGDHPWSGPGHSWNGSDPWNGSHPWHDSDHQMGSSPWNGTGPGPDDWPGGPGAGTSRGNGSTGVDVTTVALADEAVAVGESVTVSVTVANRQHAAAEFDATLLVDGAETDDGSIELGPGEERSLTLSSRVTSPGNYTVTAAGRDAGTVRVGEPEPDLAVADASLGTTTVVSNESVTVSATVANDGAANGTLDVALTADGTTAGTASATVVPGATETVTFDQSFAVAGSVDLAVAGIDAGTVEVVAGGNATDDANETGTGDEGTVGETGTNATDDGGSAGEDGDDGAGGDGVLDGSENADDATGDDGDDSEGSDGGEASEGDDADGEGDGEERGSVDEENTGGSTGAGTESSDDPADGTA